MKIYTRGGDKGLTSLLNGRRIPKHDIRIEAYGTVDELIAFCGLIRDSYSNKYYNDLIVEIQDNLMTVASMLANDKRNDKLNLPVITEDDILKLEAEIDKIDEILPPLRSFILPGGNTAVSACHIARTICRRAERRITKLSEENSTDPLILKYINRLSDFLFVLSRLISKDLDIEEITWTPSL